jgi:GT2 family glycosyltransferase
MRTEINSLRPKISVIVLNWNGKHFLEVCLTALRHQTFSDFETILVDNASTDGSAEYTRENFPEVRLVELDKNKGFAGGNNAGYEAASGEWIVLLNNDTEADLRWLEEIHKTAEENPRVGAIASKMLYFDERHRIDNCGFSLSRGGMTIDLGRGESDGPEWSSVRKVFGASAGAGAYKREMLEETGFLDEELFIIYEDVDLAFRARLYGYTCVLAPGAIVYHRYRKTLGKNPALQVYFAQRNIELVHIKNMPLGLIVRHAPQRFVYELGAALYFFKRGMGKAFLKAKMDVLPHLPSMLRKRRAIQSRRAISNASLRVMLAEVRAGSKWRKFWSAWQSDTDEARNERRLTEK